MTKHLKKMYHRWKRNRRRGRRNTVTLTLANVRSDQTITILFRRRRKNHDG